MSDPFKEVAALVETVPTSRRFGKVRGVSGLLVESHGLPDTAMGSRCRIAGRDGRLHEAEVVGYKSDTVLLMPFGTVEGIGPGCPVYPLHDRAVFRANHSLIGRVINALGEPIDGKGPLSLGGELRDLKAPPPPAGARKPLGAKLDVGVRAINTFLTVCEGQRLGIFSGSGVGKSTLMGMIARYATAEINVIGLVGERGREVMEFIHNILGEEGLHKSVVIVATGDEPPLMRRQAAYMSMTVAEYFRDCGFQVMLMLDSITRFAMAQREIGLSAGEPPTTRGFTPSVFSELPRLLERAGPGTDKGSITGIFTVLVEGGDMDEPVADAVRGIIDGHIVLDRALAERGHFPSINILKSVSRAMPMCNTPEENALVMRARQLIAAYTDMEEMIRLGAYKQGTDKEVDLAIAYHAQLEQFLRQLESQSATLADGYEALGEMLKKTVKSAD
jgi:flagellum-specific ATP synthase